MGAKSGTLTLTLLILHPGQNKTRSVLKWLKSAKSSGSHLIAWEVIDWSTVSHRLSLSFPRHYYNARPIISYLNRIWFLKVHLPRKAVRLPMLVPFLGLSSRSPWIILNQFDFQCGSLAIFRQAVPKQEWRILELPFLKDPAHVFDFACGPLDLWLLFSHEFWQVWTLDRFGGAFPFFGLRFFLCARSWCEDTGSAFTSSHFCAGFAWEVLEVFSGPPNATYLKSVGNS